jgi:hypothetical protein
MRTFHPLLPCLLSHNDLFSHDDHPGSTGGKYRRVALSLLAATCIAACSSTESVSPVPSGEAAGPVVFEREVFKGAAAFYCEHKRWPESWKDLAKARADEHRGAVSALPAGYSEPVLSSPRAILLTMSYKNEGGSTRVATFIAPPYCGDADKSDDPRDVSIAGGGIVFRLPEGFRLMKGADVKAYWKSAPYPDAAWLAGDGRLVAIRFGDVELSPSETGDFLHDLTEAYEASVPSIVWRVREVQTVGDKTFLRHEFENSSSKGRLVNVALSSSFSGLLFAITVTGPVEQTTGVLEAAGQLEDSLKVR